MASMSPSAAFAARIVLCGIVFAAAQSLSAPLVAALGLKMIELPAGVSPQLVAVVSLAASPLLPLALAPLARRLPGTLLARSARLALFTYTAFGLNTIIEGRIFSTLVGPGAFAGMLVFYALPCAALSLAVAAAFPARAAQPAPLPHRTHAAWAWRLTLAWLAFPAAYLLFGGIISPLVVDDYRQGIAGLVLPPIEVILGTQLGRSALYLATVLPVILRWGGDWRSLAVRLGWAYWVLVGLYGLITGFWMPAHLRVIHSLEISADSFAYALVLAWALRAPARRAAAAAAPHAG